MKEKINIAELLKDCPKGMELYSTIYGTVYFEGVRDTGNAVLIDVKTCCNTDVQFYPDGKFNTYYSDSEMALFPSKDVRTWEGFQRPFKNGDVVTYNLRGSLVAFIYKERINPTIVKSHFTLYAQNVGFCKNNCMSLKEDEIVFATEEEKEELFKSIKEHGYKWDAERKCLIELPKFKNGDILAAGDWVFIFKELHTNGYPRCYCHYDLTLEEFKVDTNSYMACGGDIYLATKEQQDLLFSKMKGAGYKWNTETKTLEKMIEPKEEVDDRIVMSGIYFDRENYADEVELHLGNYEIKTRNGKTYAIFKKQEAKTLKRKFKIGDRIKPISSYKSGIIVRIDDKGYYVDYSKGSGIVHVSFTLEKNYELAPNKFDIRALIPFESRVLVRNKDNDFWEPAIFGVFYAKEHALKFCIVGSRRFEECIPYEGNEHLIGTTNDCDEYFKIWK